MKVMIEHIWATKFNVLIKKLKEEKPTHLIWLGVTEFNFPESWGPSGEMKILEQILVENNINVEFITGSALNGLYLFDRLFSPKVNITIHPFPMYWIYETMKSLPDLSNVTPPPPPITEEKVYINLNRNPHPFRGMLMDSLSKNGLLNQGYNTWLRPGFYGTVYDFKHWKEEKLILKNDIQLTGLPPESGRDLNNFVTPPPEFYSSTINLVCESTDDVLFYTEKTFKNFFYQKPFIILGAQNINSTLKHYGFELYDEIFDYSFDTHSNIEDRVEGVVDNIKKISRMNQDVVKQKVSHKIKHNYHRMMEIYYGKLYIPPIIEHFIKNNNPRIKEIFRHAY